MTKRISSPGRRIAVLAVILPAFACSGDGNPMGPTDPTSNAEGSFFGQVGFLETAALETLVPTGDYDLLRIRVGHAVNGYDGDVHFSFKNVGTIPGPALAELFVNPAEDPDPRCSGWVEDEPGRGGGKASFEANTRSIYCPFFWAGLREHTVEVRLTDGTGQHSLSTTVVVSR